MTTTILLLLVAAASTIAFSPPAFSGARRRRDVPSGSHSGSGAGAVSFASSSSSSSGAGSGPGYSTSISSRSGFSDPTQGLNSVNPSNPANPGGYGYSGTGGDFSFPNNYVNPYGGGAGYMPIDFHTLFMQYLDFMQRMAQQQAYAPKTNFSGGGVGVGGGSFFRLGPAYISWPADGTSASPSITTTSVASTPYYHTSNRLPTSQYYNIPASSAQQYTAPSTYTSSYYYNTPPYYYSTPTSTSKYFYNTQTSNLPSYNNAYYTSRYFSTPISTYRNYNTPVYTYKYMNTPEYTTKYSDIPSKTLSRKSLKTINVSKPNISTRQLLQASSKLSTNGQSALKHYARSSAAVSINGGDISSRSGFAGPDNYGAPQSGFYFPGQTGYPGDGQVSASASASLTPRGGFGSVSISPPPQGNPELATRMGSVPVSGGGGNFAVMSSSSSSSSDIDGVKKTFKEATSVINDNGKVTTFHVRDPQ